MIVKVTRVLMLIITILVVSVYLPKIYWKIFDKSYRIPLVLYSPVINQFITFNSVDTPRYSDEKGNTYTRSEFEALEPIFYYRQLLSEKRMPDSLRGVELDVNAIRIQNFRVRVIPAYITMPTITLLPMFESQSGRVSLEMPTDVFRFANNRLEFIDCESNSVDEEKTELFSEALSKEGFVFPAKSVYGNPTTRKPFDEGYFAVDNTDQIFHMKMVKGLPVCKNINAPKDFKVKYMSIAETNLREFYGLIITQEDKLFIIAYDNYKLINVPAQGYNSKNTNLIFKGDIFFRAVQMTNSDSATITMLDKEYKPFARHMQKVNNVKKTSFGTVANYLFPFSTDTADSKTYLVNLYFEFSSFVFLILNVILTVISVLLYKKRGYLLKNNVVDFVLVLITGIYGFIAINIFIPFDKTK